MTTLFDPLKLGDLTLKNRLVMAPLTRMRSRQPGNIPWKLNAEYYAQRASAGLIISEATQISPQGQGYPATPGIHSPEQVAGWCEVTKAVHKSGGLMFLQLWHVGRISHRSLQPGNQLPVAPSAIKADGGTYSPDWKPVTFETPRALETAEISGLVADYKTAAINAKEAGFDGVEIHGANGYLIDQFLQDGSNKRTDRYGGSIENRTRFLLEIVEAVSEVWPKSRVGVRLSPHGTFNSMHDSDPKALFTHVITELSARGLGYVHVIEPRSSKAGEVDSLIEDAVSAASSYRHCFEGVFISAGGYDRPQAVDAVATGRADLIAFGRLFIANPDLPTRFKLDAPLNRYDRKTFYGGAEKGYTDYPALDANLNS